MRRYLPFFVLCLIFFCLPLQIFVIGNNLGIGIQGAVYRFQVTEYGNYFFPITREILFVMNGTLTGKTALSISLWAAATALLACTIVFAFIHVNDTTTRYYRQIVQGLFFSCVIYLGSLIIQYGFLFSGPAGISIPLGILLILVWTAVIWYYKNTFGTFLNFFNVRF